MNGGQGAMLEKKFICMTSSLCIVGESKKVGVIQIEVIIQYLEKKY